MTEWKSIKEHGFPKEEGKYLVCEYRKKLKNGFFEFAEVYKIQIVYFRAQSLKTKFNIENYHSVTEWVEDPAFVELDEDNNQYDEIPVTHWMPLPEPPLIVG